MTRGHVTAACSRQDSDGTGGPDAEGGENPENEADYDCLAKVAKQTELDAVGRTGGCGPGCLLVSDSEGALEF